jgi:hypothetical protein
MPKTADEIASALMGGLYKFVSLAAGDGEATNADPFVAWCKPGIPFEPEDFRFAKFMLIGQGATDDERAADFSLQLTQAAGFSRFVDFVPSVDGIVAGKMEGGVLRPGSAALSEIYRRILESSQIAQLPEPQGINEQIKALQTQAAPLREAYNSGQEAFEAARAEYVGARMAAGMSAVERLKFQSTGPQLKSKLKRARQNWEVEGSKTQYENLLAEIDSLRAKRSPAIWRSEAIDAYNSLPEGENATFGEARMTIPFPGSFASNTGGWASFALKLENVDELSRSKTTKWSVDGSFGWGSLKLGGSAAGSTAEKLAIKNTDGFSLKLSIAQVPLLRRWFDPWFLRSEFWRYNPATIEGQNNVPVSDGGSPPKGLLVGYPVSAIFVREVEIGMAELHDETSELVKTLKGEAKGGWGFGVLNVGGSYERNSEERRHKANVADGKLTIPGLQLVGYIIEPTSEKPEMKLPNPKPGLTWVAGG